MILADKIVENRKKCGWSQEELADKLRNAGYAVTQATVSRDIRELKLTKVPMGDGRQKYTILIHSDHYLSDKYKDSRGIDPLSKHIDFDASLDELEYTENDIFYKHSPEYWEKEANI